MGLHGRDDQGVSHEQESGAIGPEGGMVGEVEKPVYWHRERSLRLPGSGRKSCRLQNAEFVVLGDAPEQIGIALPLD